MGTIASDRKTELASSESLPLGSLPAILVGCRDESLELHSVGGDVEDIEDDRLTFTGSSDTLVSLLFRSSTLEVNLSSSG